MGKTKTKVLVASTDPSFLQETMGPLRIDYDVQLATSTEASTFLIREWEPLILLIDGDSLIFNSLSQIRHLVPIAQMGIIVLSSFQNPEKEEKSFRDGSDYFLSSNSSPKGLRLRISSLLRRISSGNSSLPVNAPPVSMGGSWNAESNLINFMDILIYPNDFLVKRKSEIINTTPTQFKLLLAFVSRPEHLLSRQWLKENVWENASISYRSIDAQISKLKRQIPELENILINIYGKGYILTKPQNLAA